MKKKFKQYYYGLLDDYLFFSPNIDKDIELFQNTIIEKEHIEYLNNNLDHIYQKNIYPSFIRNNVDKLLDFLIKKIDENDRFLLEMNKYFSFKIDNSYELYGLELMTKFDELELYLHPFQAIKEEDIIKSMRYDFLIFQSCFLSSNDYDNYLPNLVDNPYYLLSIKKFLIEIPELFSNITIKKRVVEVLKILLKNTTDEKQKNDIENIFRKIDKNKSNDYFVLELENIYLSSLTKKIISTDKMIDYDLAKSDYYLNYLNETVDDFQYNISEEGKARILKFLNSFLDINNPVDKKIFLNELIYKFSKLQHIESEDIYKAEYKYKTPLLEKIFDKIYRIKLNRIIFNIKYSISVDFDYIKGLLESEEQFDKLLEENYFEFPYFNYTIQYLLNIDEKSFFDNQILYDRIKRIFEYQKNDEYISYMDKIDIKIIQKRIEKKRG